MNNLNIRALEITEATKKEFESLRTQIRFEQFRAIDLRTESRRKFDSKTSPARVRSLTTSIDKLESLLQKVDRATFDDKKNTDQTLLNKFRMEFDGLKRKVGTRS